MANGYPPRDAMPWMKEEVKPKAVHDKDALEMIEYTRTQLGGLDGSSAEILGTVIRNAVTFLAGRSYPDLATVINELQASAKGLREGYWNKVGVKNIPASILVNDLNAGFIGPAFYAQSYGSGAKGRCGFPLPEAVKQLPDSEI